MFFLIFNPAESLMHLAALIAIISGMRTVLFRIYYAIGYLGQRDQGFCR
jgi:hypothetical protein